MSAFSLESEFIWLVESKTWTTLSSNDTKESTNP